MTTGSYLMSAEEVVRELGVSKGHAYKLVRTMNQELAKSGYVVVAGKVPRPYWNKKLYGLQFAADSGREGL